MRYRLLCGLHVEQGVAIVMNLSHLFVVSIMPSCVLSVYVHVCVSDGRFPEIICWKLLLVLLLT